MKITILAVLLAIMQAAPPIPRKAADTPAQDANKIKKDAAKDKEPVAPPAGPVESSQKPIGDEKPGDNKTPENTEHSVRIRELPPVSITRDWADWILWAASALLALVGIFGIGFAYFTLRAIKEQTDLQRVAMEQWINTFDWEARAHHIQPTATEAELNITFRLGNPTKFTMTLRTTLLWINRQHASTVLYGNPLLVPPDDDIPVAVSLRLEGQRLADYRAGHLVLEIGGLVYFIDAFKEERQQTFGVIGTCGPLNTGDFDICAFTPPDDKELETRKRMLERIEKIGKKKGKPDENPN